MARHRKEYSIVDNVMVVDEKFKIICKGENRKMAIKICDALNFKESYDETYDNFKKDLL